MKAIATAREGSFSNPDGDCRVEVAVKTMSGRLIGKFAFYCHPGKVAILEQSYSSDKLAETFKGYIGFLVMDEVGDMMTLEDQPFTVDF